MTAPQACTLDTSQVLARNNLFSFIDGNIALAADTTAFVVHEAVLVRHSQSFAHIVDRFHIEYAATPPDSRETMNGCPVLRVPDSAYDIKHMLYAILLNPTETVPFSILASLARMGHKYRIPALLTEATRRLESVYTLTACQSRHRSGSTALATVEPQDAIEALNLLRTIGRNDLVPAAFYACCLLDDRTLLQGAMRADGVTFERLRVKDLERIVD
ncbi:hypothetical protein C8Q76DRAFT_624395, partial [Earliella scabrosa]